MNRITRQDVDQHELTRAGAARVYTIGWGAAIVDENGNETPITESMIESACNELAASWLFPRRECAGAR